LKLYSGRHMPKQKSEPPSATASMFIHYRKIGGGNVHVRNECPPIAISYLEVLYTVITLYQTKKTQLYRMRLV